MTIIIDSDTPGESDNKKVASATPVAVIMDAEGHQDGGPSPEEALAASRKAIEAADNKARAAQQREQQAQQELARMRQSQQTDQAAVLAAAVEASTAERNQHSAAWRAAMESGDFAAAEAFQKDLIMATAKLERATGELAMVKAGAAQPRQQQQPQQQAVPSQTQAWIKAHPEFDRRPEVRDALVLLHNQLHNDGVVVESPRYWREIDAEYERLVGGNDGRSNDMNGSGRNTPPQRQQFDGAPPSRGSNGGGSAGSAVTTLLGTIHVRQVNGQTQINIPQALRGDFAEGAKVTGMSVEEYAMDQIRIARERAAGGNGGLITSEGNVYK